MFNGYQLSKKVRSGGDEIPRLVSGLGTSEQLLTTPWCVRTVHTGRMRAEEAAEWLEHAGLTRCWRKEPLCSLANCVEISGSRGGLCGRILGTWVFVRFGQPEGSRSRGGRLKRGPKPQVGPERSCQAGFSAAGTHVQRGSRTVLSDSESWHLYFLLSSLRLFLNVLSPNMGILFMHTGLWVLSQELYGLVMVCSLPETLRGPHLQSHPGSLEPCWSPRA